MTDQNASTGSEGTEPAPAEEKLKEAGELRTIAFRMRELQRLLGARVAQENRRLEAEGLEPVTESDIFRPEDARDKSRDK